MRNDFCFSHTVWNFERIEEKSCRRTSQVKCPAVQLSQQSQQSQEKGSPHSPLAVKHTLLGLWWWWGRVTCGVGAHTEVSVFFSMQEHSEGLSQCSSHGAKAGGSLDSSPDYRKATCTVETVNLSTSHLSNSVMYRLTLILTVVMTACNHWAFMIKLLTTE